MKVVSVQNFTVDMPNSPEQKDDEKRGKRDGGRHESEPEPTGRSTGPSVGRGLKY